MANPIQGYFDSDDFTLDVNGFPIWNRAVGSEFMAKFAHTVLGDGAAAVTTGGFQVVKKTGMIVTVKPYFIAKNGYMMYQTAETDIEFTSSTSEQVFYIGARLDVANNHFLHDDVYYYTTFDSETDIASCKLTIAANAVTITDGMIEDLRYGTAHCGQLDEYRERSLALIAELEDALATALAGGIPAHASTHAADGSDPITPSNIDAVSYSSQTLSSGEQTQARTNISAAKAVDGEVDAIESGLVIDAYTDNVTVALSNVGHCIEVTSASDKTVTVPPQSSVAFEGKSYFFIRRGGAGAVTVAAGSGVTLQAPGSRMKVAEQYGMIMVYRKSSNTWGLTGAMSS